MLQYVGTTGKTIEQRLSVVLSFLDLVGARQILKVAVHRANFLCVFMHLEHKRSAQRAFHKVVIHSYDLQHYRSSLCVSC